MTAFCEEATQQIIIMALQYSVNCIYVCLFSAREALVSNKLHMRTNNERRLITETGHTHFGTHIQAYVAKEAARPCKQWIHEVLSSKREADRVKLRTSTFVLLPDVDCMSKRAKKQPDKEPNNSNNNPYSSYSNHYLLPPIPINNPLFFWQGGERAARRLTHPTPSFHWLAVVADTSLRTLRDLRGVHVQMLQSLHSQACQKIFEESGTEPGQVLAYVHYPPSVYQLHIHFKHLAGPNVFHDTFRVHPLLSIINNLQIDSDFYKKSNLQLPVYVHTELYNALEAGGGITNNSISHLIECPCSTSPGSTPSTPDATDERATSSATPDGEASGSPSLHP